MGSAVRGGISRTDAARIGDMDRQTLRDWVHRFRGGDLVADAPLDQLIGSRKDRPWDREVQCPRGPEVDDPAVAVGACSGVPRRMRSMYPVHYAARRT
jgi:transposase-like protein